MPCREESPRVAFSKDYATARENLEKGSATPQQQKLLHEKLEETEKAILVLRQSNMCSW